jgi:hypothetical protein
MEYIIKKQDEEVMAFTIVEDGVDCGIGYPLSSTILTIPEDRVGAVIDNIIKVGNTNDDPIFYLNKNVTIEPIKENKFEITFLGVSKNIESLEKIMEGFALDIMGGIVEAKNE